MDEIDDCINRILNEDIAKTLSSHELLCIWIQLLIKQHNIRTTRYLNLLRDYKSQIEEIVKKFLTHIQQTDTFGSHNSSYYLLTVLCNDNLSLLISQISSVYKRDDYKIKKLIDENNKLQKTCIQWIIEMLILYNLRIKILKNT